VVREKDPAVAILCQRNRLAFARPQELERQGSQRTGAACGYPLRQRGDPVANLHRGLRHRELIDDGLGDDHPAVKPLEEIDFADQDQVMERCRIRNNQHRAQASFRVRLATNSSWNFWSAAICSEVYSIQTWRVLRKPSSS